LDYASPLALLNGDATPSGSEMISDGCPKVTRATLGKVMRVQKVALIAGENNIRRHFSFFIRSASRKQERISLYYVIDMKTTLLMVLCCIFTLASGCAAGISRIGYQLPQGKTPKDLQRCPIAIQCNVQYDTNDVAVLGSIHAYDTSVSIDCDEAYVLDIFCREGCMLGADLINITEENQPDLWSSCYRARAQFLRFKDREKVNGLLSNAKYAPNLIIGRSAKSNKRNIEVITGAVVAGPLGMLAVWSATDPNNHPNYTNSIPPKDVKKP
jgi:hypothetical protein